MHERPMPEYMGQLEEPEKSDRPCPKCNSKQVVVQVWESSCGGYEDYKYTCGACKHVWWIDGIDS